MSPFIKLSLVRPLLLVFPDRKLKIRIVTRLSPFTFRQNASDLLALELLRKRPVAGGQTDLFQFNRLHAKVYIADRRRVLLGSSNLSISGFERNFEMALLLEDPKFAAEILDVFSQKGAFDSPVLEESLLALHAKLGSDPLEEFQEPTEIEDRESQEVEEQPLADILSDSSVGGIEEILQPDHAERLHKIRQFVAINAKDLLNSIGGQPSVSAVLPIEKDAEGNTSPVFTTNLAVAVATDFGHLKAHLFSRLPAILPKEAKNTVALFLMERKLAELVATNAGNITQQAAAARSLGKSILSFVLSFHFARQIAYEPKSAALASIAFQNTLTSLDYSSPLIERGIYIYLHRGDLPKDFDRELFYRLVGGVGLHSLRRAISWARYLVEDQLLYARAIDAKLDPKTFLQQVGHALGTQLAYETVRSGGSEHAPEFTCTVRLGKRYFESVIGDSKKSAELKAAAVAISKLETEPEKVDALAAAAAVGFDAQVLESYNLEHRRKRPLSEIREALGLPLSTPLNLLDMALTHRSVLRVRPSARSFDRLSLVGSKLLDVLSAREAILNPLNTEVEGAEAVARFRQLADDQVSSLFDKFELLRHLERVNLTDDLVSRSLKQDVGQALLAVSYLGGGIEHAEGFWTSLLLPQLTTITSSATAKEEITWLQEVLMASGKPPPEYQGARRPESPEHAPVFVCKCLVEGIVMGEGEGRSLKLARREAARQVLIKMDLILPTS